MTKAHATTETFHLHYSYPDHEPREDDPHYHLFTAARARMKKLGLLVCWIGNADCRGGIQLHHAQVEFALANDIDLAKWNRLYPDLHCEDDDAFAAFVEGEGNLTPLCQMHHVGILGIHCVHYPAWVVQRVLKDGIEPPEKKVPA